MSITNMPPTRIRAISGKSASAEASRQGSQQSLLRFALEKSVNRRYLSIAVVGSIVQLIIFKLCYPFPDFMSDSYNYIESAAFNLNANIWPVGYAKFLIFVHSISHSDLLLVSIQYGLVQLSLLYFFYTILYLYKPSVLAAKILFVVIFFNPASLYLSNYVLSDALFGSVTILWFSLLLRLLTSPSKKLLLIQVLLMGLAFTIRYTAMFYPLVAAVALLISPVRLLEKLLWIISPALLFFPFISFTKAETKAVTGTAEFSVFAGWQIANNALYMYGNIRVDSTRLPIETRRLDRMVKQYYRKSQPSSTDLNDFEGTFFIKHQDAPLKQYMYRFYPNEAQKSALLSWGKVSPIYNQYGSWLVSHYPLAFARNYLWLNTKNYFNPYLAQMGLYNVGLDSVWDVAQYWFHYPTWQVRSISNEFQGMVFISYPPIFLLLNVYFGGCLLWLGLSRKFRQLDPVFKKALWLMLTFCVMNFEFSIFATPVVLRYEVVPMLFLFSFSVLLFELTDVKQLRRPN
jgi:uncharacterized membrane protein YjfL (UPF0719 family)